jgi:hypothetical protein
VCVIASRHVQYISMYYIGILFLTPPFVYCFFLKEIIDYGTTGLVISRTLGGLYFVDQMTNSNNDTSVQCSINLHLQKMHHPMEDYVLMPEMIICCILQRLR